MSTPKRPNTQTLFPGFTLIELLVVIGIIGAVYCWIMLIIALS